MKTLHTIGHSTYKIDDFLALLQKNKINTIVDVRSIPYSKFASQYNREYLKAYLRENNIYYIFMGDLLGAKYDDESLLFDSGIVDFKRVQKTLFFTEGISRLEKGLNQDYSISLMCSEKEAFDCHRFGLISEYIDKNLDGIEIKHIYPNKILSQKDLESRLIKKYDKYIDYLELNTHKSPLEQAYVFRNQDIGYEPI